MRKITVDIWGRVFLEAANETLLSIKCEVCILFKVGRLFFCKIPIDFYTDINYDAGVTEDRLL